MSSCKNSFLKILECIYARIDEPLCLREIAESAGVSLSSLKRIFLEATDQSAGAFIRRLRMERAFRSLRSNQNSILEVALGAGFEDHAAFSRCFKKTFGYQPSFSRTKQTIIDDLECIVLEEPEIVELSDIVLQSITTQGTYFTCAPQAWEALEQKLTAEDLEDDFPGIFVGIGWDNPHEGEVLEFQVRFSAGVALLDRDLGIEKTVITAGPYAKFRYVGKLNNLGLAYHYIYGRWLAAAEVKINTKLPAFIALAAFPKDFSELGVAIYVPVVAEEA